MSSFKSNGDDSFTTTSTVKMLETASGTEYLQAHYSQPLGEVEVLPSDSYEAWCKVTTTELSALITP